MEQSFQHDRAHSAFRLFRVLRLTQGLERRLVKLFVTSPYAARSNLLGSLTKETKKLQKSSKHKKQQTHQLQPQEPQDDLWLEDLEFNMDYDDGDSEFDYYIKI